MKSLVLYIEDNKFDQLLVSNFLHKHGIECEIAVNLEEGKKSIEKNYYDAVITDFQLPDGTGMEIVRNYFEKCPILFPTGSGDEMLAVEAMKAGAVDYFVKDPNQNYLELIITHNTCYRHTAAPTERSYIPPFEGGKHTGIHILNCNCACAAIAFSLSVGMV